MSLRKTGPQDAIEIKLTPGNKTCQADRVAAVTITGLEDTEYVMKHFWIRAPENRKIKITYNFASYTGGSWCSGGCPFGGMEIKAQKDQATTGYRFCCREENVVLSESSLVPVIVYHRKDMPREYSFCAEIDAEIATTTVTPTTIIPTTVPTTAQPTTTTQATTTRPAAPGSCVDSEGRVKNNGETWREPSTNVEWKCHNGYPEVIKCWFQWNGMELKAWFLGVFTNIKARCIENGMVPDESTEDKGSCKDKFGVVRKTGEQWEEPSTLVTWVCMKNGYPRVVSCRDPIAYSLGPVKLGKCPVYSPENGRTFFCQPDGLNEVEPDYTAPGFEDFC